MSRTRILCHLLLLAGCLALPTTFAATKPGGGTIKCWTNKDGVRECGNTVPPEYIQQEVDTLNKRGVTIDVKERAKTKDELEQERAAREAEEKRLAEEKRRREEQAAYDQMLLATFTSEQDLLEARDRKLAAIDASIEITGITIGTLEQKLTELRKRAAGLERGGSAVPADLKEDMVSIEKQIGEKRKYIEYQQQEKQEMNEKYAADLQRYRELRAVKPR